MTKTINGIAVLEKSINILEYLINYPDGVQLAEISRNLKLSKSTVHRILSTFRQFNYVIQDSQTGFYSLGGRILKFEPYITGFDLVNILRPFMQQFTDTTGLSTNLALMENYRSVTVETCIPAKTSTIRIEAEKGYRDLIETVKRGYSVENLENEEHIISLGAPVYDAHDNICAVIATMMLALNVTDEEIHDLGIRLKNIAAQASLALGAKRD